MDDLTAISKKLPRGKSFEAGKSGNPTGRPKRTEEEVSLIEACKAKAPEALRVIEQIMYEGESDKVRLTAANIIIERGYGKPIQQQVIDQTMSHTFEAEQARRMMELYLSK
jgi:hypothetical protein